MPDKAWTNTAIIADALLLTGCGKTPDNEQGSSNPFVPTKAQLEKVRDEGPLQTARGRLEAGILAARQDHASQWHGSGAGRRGQAHRAIARRHTAGNGCDGRVDAERHAGKAIGGDAPWGIGPLRGSARAQRSRKTRRCQTEHCLYVVRRPGPSAAEIEQPKAMATEFSRRLTNPSLRYSRGDGNEPAYRFNGPH